MLNAVSFTVVTVLGISSYLVAMFTDPGQVLASYMPPHTEHHDDADNTIQEIKRKHHHDVQCGENVRGGNATRVRENGDDVAGNTQNSNGSEADGVEHSK
nr:probable protein S-acyltransferase 16 [Ipomoea batatas]